MNNERKMRYEEPSLDIIMFTTEDVIVTSSGDFNGDIDPVSGDVILPKVNFD